MNKIFFLLGLACIIFNFSTKNVSALPLVDSTSLSASQISNLQALQAPGQIPVGTVIPWPSDQRIPEPMWLPCNGQYIASDSPLSKAIGGNTIPDLNGVKDTVNSNGNGLFIRGGAIAKVASTDSIRYQYHGQKEHTHQIKMGLRNPSVTGTASGQLYYDWLTGGASTTSKNVEEHANWKGYDGGKKFRKFQYNVSMGNIEGDSSLDDDTLEKVQKSIDRAKAAGFYSEPGDPYYFTSDNMIGGFAFTIPEAKPVDNYINTDGWSDSFVHFEIGHEGVGVDNPSWTESYTHITRFLGTIKNKTEDGKIQDNSGGLSDTTVGGAIKEGGNDDYEYTGGAETTPQYKNVVYIIKALP